MRVWLARARRWSEGHAGFSLIVRCCFAVRPGVHLTSPRHLTRLTSSPRRATRPPWPRPRPARPGHEPPQQPARADREHDVAVRGVARELAAAREHPQQAVVGQPGPDRHAPARAPAGPHPDCGRDTFVSGADDQHIGPRMPRARIRSAARVRQWSGGGHHQELRRLDIEVSVETERADPSPPAPAASVPSPRWPARG